MSTDSLSDSGHPVKRARLESHESVHEPIVDVLEHEDDDLEDADLYGTSDQAAAIPAAAEKPQQSTPDRSTISTTTNLNSVSVSKSPEIPGLFMGTAEPAQEAVQAVPTELPTAPEPTIAIPDAETTEDYVPFETETDHEHDEAEEDTNMGEAPHEAEDTKPEDVGAQEVPTEAAPMEDVEHVAKEAFESKLDEADVQLQQEAHDQLENKQSAPVDETPTATLSDSAQPEVKKDESEQTTAELLSSMFAPKPAEARSKPAPDPEFLAAAEAQKDDENAEWRFDSSDAESSDSDSSDSSDGDSDEEYSKMKPEEIAKLLLKEIDEDGDRSAPGPLRTKNEVPEEEVKVERPAIEVTDSIKIEPLGFVDSIVGVMVLVKATTSGNHKVLSEGSLLVTEDRKVIGTIADTLGRVEEPLYTVRFNSAVEMEELTIEVGRKIFYVPEHSTYVFTQPLLAQKGSDASNIHDEEVGDGDAEFSDDEQEMEHKRRQKEARRNTSINKNPAPPGPENKQPQQQQKKRPHGGPAPVVTDEPYVPLQRPANLHELLSQPPPPPPSSLNRGGHRGDRGGRGRGGNRGNDRGGRGGRGGRGRDGNRGGRGRGGDNHQQNQRNPQQQQQQQPHNAPNKPSQYQQPPAQQAQNPHQAPPPTPQFNFQQPPQFPPLPGFPNFQLPPFNGVPPPPPPHFPMVPNMPGAHVNPTFYEPNAPQQSQQQQQQQQAYNWMQAFTQAQQQQPAAPPPVAAPQQNTQSSADAFRALQNTLDMLRQKPPAPQ